MQLKKDQEQSQEVVAQKEEQHYHRGRLFIPFNERQSLLLAVFFDAINTFMVYLSISVKFHNEN